MFIVVNFGYKQYRIFSIECLTASLMDTILSFSSKDMAKLVSQKEENHGKEIVSLTKKKEDMEKTIQNLTTQIEEEKRKQEEALKEAEKLLEQKGGDKKNAPKPAPKKDPKKPDIAQQSPLEIERTKVTADLEKVKKYLDKYAEKIVKLKEQQKKVQDNQNITLDLVDKGGERRFCNTKQESIANTFLGSGVYYLAKVLPPLQNETEERVELITLDGYAIRTCQEDEEYVEVPEIQLKEKDKKKPKKK